MLEGLRSRCRGEPEGRVRVACLTHSPPFIHTIFHYFYSPAERNFFYIDKNLDALRCAELG